jgi:phenylacetate-CoA ligase
MPNNSRSTPDLENLQLEKLQRLLNEIILANRFWTAKLATAGVKPTDIRTLADLQKLPFTTKSELVADQQTHPPYGSNLTFDVARYVRLHQTSGTTGAPLRWLDTVESWNWMLDCWRQLFDLMDLRPNDRLFFPFSFGPFLGFWAGFEGAARRGNFCLAGGGLSSQARLQLMLDNAITVVCCTPTYALRLAEVAAEQRIELANSPVRKILVAGEPGGNVPATRNRIETAWGARVVDHWGMTELGPLAIEAADSPGTLTVLETECIAEIIDPQTLVPVPAGTEGELVITNLGRIGSPLIRYRTGDLVKSAPSPLTPDPSPPPGERGEMRAFLRLDGGILGRADDMVTIRGNNVYPSTLENVVRQFDTVAEYRITLHSSSQSQRLRIEIEPTRDAVSAAQVDRTLSDIAREIRDRWHLQADVEAVPVGSLPRFEMKARRFVKILEQP